MREIQRKTKIMMETSITDIMEIMTRNIIRMRKILQLRKPKRNPKNQKRRKQKLNRS